MRYIYILSALLLFNNCAPDSQLRMGCYKSFIPTKIEMFWKAIFSDINGYVVKTGLIIKQDSSFKFSTCSSVSTGNWAISKDSLFLHVKDCHWNYDSLNKVGYHGSWPDLPSKLIRFGIHHNYLETIVSSKIKNKTILLLKFDMH